MDYIYSLTSESAPSTIYCLLAKNSDLKDSTRYKLFWDASANWFGYKDVTPRWQPPAPAAPAYTPPPVSYDYYEPASEEIYYEDEEVVGS